jgi:hypothetical protein
MAQVRVELVDIILLTKDIEKNNFEIALLFLPFLYLFFFCKDISLNKGDISLFLFCSRTVFSHNYLSIQTEGEFSVGSLAFQGVRKIKGNKISACNRETGSERISF